MAVTESFLVNTNSFNAIIEALIELDEAPEEITDELLISLGFESPSDLLVVHMLKELDMVTVDGEPTDLYHEMTDTDTTDEAIATGLIRAYTDLFEQNRDFHKLQKEDIHKELNEYFDGRKTDLIIKYMTNTFHKLVTYAGLNNVQKAVDRYFKDQPLPKQEAADEEVDLEDEPTLSENGLGDEDQAAESHSEIESEDAGEKEVSETDDEFDDVFFSDDNEEEEEITADLEEETVDIAGEEDDEEEDELAGKGKKGSINFDELPQVKQEEKGSKNIFDFFSRDSKDEDEDEETLEASSEEAKSEEDVPEETEDTEIFADAEDEIELQEEETEHQEELNEADRTDKTEDVEESQESLEQELLEINMETNNGYHTNGAENKENPMANLTNIPTNEKIEKAIIKKAELLYKLERFEDVLPAYNDVISYFDDSDKDHLKEAVAKAVINRVAVLNKLNREDDLLPALDEVITRFEDSSTTEYYEQASMAMLQKSQLLEDGSPEELLSLYNDIIDRLRTASSPKIKKQVDDIFINRVDLLSENGSENELLNAVEDLIDRFKDSQLQNGELEQAMYKKAEILENLNRDEEALEAYSEFLEKFGKTKEAV
jgi:hypothetical protein